MNDENKGTIGRRIRLERERLSLSQVAMAEKLGITARTQRNYETGTRVPDVDYLMAASKVGVNLSFVMHADDPNVELDEADEGVLFHMQTAFGLKREDIHEAIAMGLLNCTANVPYGIDPEIVFSKLKQCSPVIQSIFEKETNIDTRLLADILVDVDAVLADQRLPLTPEKKARAVTMIYRFCKPNGKVIPGLIEEAVKLASS